MKEKIILKDKLITGSVVVFHNSPEDIRKVIDSFLGYGSSSILFIIDNSSENSLKKLCNNPRIKYIFNNANLGFGAAHNIAFKEAYKLNSSYHILINPDVYFEPSIISNLIQKADSDTSIGMIMPKIVYPDGSTQFLCKLLPTPMDLIFRRFSPFKKIKRILENKYELRFFSYEKEAVVPVLSGCFMMIRSSDLKKVSGFDERFFMYLEDVDFCRRMGEISKLLYYPKVKVFHNYEKGSYKDKRLLVYHIKSAVKYFNKWGWVFDKARYSRNQETLISLHYKK